MAVAPYSAVAVPAGASVSRLNAAFAAPPGDTSMAGAVSPRDRRLHEGWQFRDVYQSGKSFHGSLMTLVSLTKPEDRGRHAFVASRKVGGAVQRNRAKRLLREAYRAIPAERRDEPRWRVWIARASCSRSTLSSVSAEMTRLIGQERR